MAIFSVELDEALAGFEGALRRRYEGAFQSELIGRAPLPASNQESLCFEFLHQPSGRLLV
jgi:hypothetical protein